MNCKQGDLAVYVKVRVPSNLGKFVEILEPIGFLNKGTEFEKDGTRWCVAFDDFYWWVEAASTITASQVLKPYKRIHAGDSTLRHIRDNPGQDETLQWAPVPKKVEA